MCRVWISRPASSPVVQPSAHTACYTLYDVLPCVQRTSRRRMDMQQRAASGLPGAAVDAQQSRSYARQRQQQHGQQSYSTLQSSLSVDKRTRGQPWMVP
jgi:hypothetical protein